MSINSLGGLFLIFFLTGLVYEVIGQKESVIDRQYILQLENHANIDYVTNTLQLKGLDPNSFSYNQLMSAPLNLWLFEIDAAYNEVKPVLEMLKTIPEITCIMQNRYISERAIPDDPDFAKQWQYINDGSSGGLLNADLDMDFAWDITTGGLTTDGDTIVICIIDSGINASHPDLKDNLWKNRFEFPGNGIDDDGNGYVDDFSGWNAVDGNDLINNNSNHGSAVAGIVGAKGNNGVGVAGVNWDVKMMIVNYGRPTEANALASYAYPYIMRKRFNETNGTEGAFVVATNASWGLDRTKPEDAPIWCALYDSLGSVGIINCGATINEGVDVDQVGDMPTACESEFIISVTNLNRSDVKVGAAGFGYKSIDLGAYGNSTYTTTASGYGAFGGTSAATPHVAGTIGLMYSTQCNGLISVAKSDPSAAAIMAKDMLLHAVVPNESLKNITTSGGRLNTHRALQNIIKLCESCAPPSGIRAEVVQNNVQIFWSGFSGNATVNLRYRKEGTDNWQVLEEISNGQIINDLDNCQVYEYQLGTNCGLLPGEFSYSKYFKTSNCCRPPSNITLFPGDTVLDLRFDNPEIFTSYEIEYRTFKGEWQIQNNVSNKIQLNNLSLCTYYDIRIKTICTEFDTVSAYTSIISGTTNCGDCTANSYCEIRNVDSSQEWIESIKIGGTIIQTGRSNSGYGYHLGVGDIVLKERSDVQIDITPGFAGQTYEEFYKIYVDFNQNAVWDDEELVYFNSSGIRGNVSGMINVPEIQFEGYTRMRIIMTYDTFPGGCAHPMYEFGETEDYCVWLQKAQCPVFTGVQVLAIDTNSISFIPVFNDISSDSIQLLLINGNTGFSSTFNILSDTIRIAGLDSCTTYTYNLITYCNGILSENIWMDTFKTACSSSTFNFNPNDGLALYPNPAINKIYLKWKENPGTLSEIGVFTVDGKKLNCDVIPYGPGMTMIDLSQLNSGLYFLQINYTGKQIMTKVIKI